MLARQVAASRAQRQPKGGLAATAFVIHQPQVDHIGGGDQHQQRGHRQQHCVRCELLAQAAFGEIFDRGFALRRGGAAFGLHLPQNGVDLGAGLRRRHAGTQASQHFEICGAQIVRRGEPQRAKERLVRHEEVHYQAAVGSRKSGRQHTGDAQQAASHRERTADRRGVAGQRRLPIVVRDDHRLIAAAAGVEDIAGGRADTQQIEEIIGDAGCDWVIVVARQMHWRSHTVLREHALEERPARLQRLKLNPTDLPRAALPADRIDPGQAAWIAHRQIAQGVRIQDAEGRRAEPDGQSRRSNRQQREARLAEECAEGLHTTSERRPSLSVGLSPPARLACSATAKLRSSRRCG